MPDTMSPYQPILDLAAQISACQDGGGEIAAAALVFVGIDTMAWLALPVGTENVTRAPFCDWVNTYLKADADSQYQYAGQDVYAARCGLLHNFSSLSNQHRTATPPKRFAYTDNGQHCTDGGDMVIISIAVFVRDFGRAVTDFLKAAAADADLNARILHRTPRMLRIGKV